MPALFILRYSVDDDCYEHHCESINDVLDDNILQGALENGGVVCSVWVRDIRITRDLDSWDVLVRQLKENEQNIKIFSRGRK